MCEKKFVLKFSHLKIHVIRNYSHPKLFHSLKAVAVPTRGDISQAQCCPILVPALPACMFRQELCAVTDLRIHLQKRMLQQSTFNFQLRLV